MLISTSLEGQFVRNKTTWNRKSSLKPCVPLYHSRLSQGSIFKAPYAHGIWIRVSPSRKNRLHATVYPSS
jgi:hypothetical protein